MKAHIVLYHYMKIALVCIIEDNFQIQAPGAYIRGAYYRRSLRLRFGGLVYGRAYTRRGLFSEFYGMEADVSSISLACGFQITWFVKHIY